MLPKNFRLHLFVWIFIIISFILLAAYLILRVSEYSFNLKNGTLEKNALLVVASDPPKSKVYLNNRLVGRTPVKLHYLRPALYQLRIEQEGYQKYERTLHLEAGKYQNVNALLFFRDTPSEKVFSQDWGKEVKKEKDDISQDVLAKIPQAAQDIDQSNRRFIYRINSEIWLYQPEAPDDAEYHLVARYFTDIRGLKFYPDGERLFFLSQNELHIMELTGTNDISLLKTNASEFWPSKDGRFVYLKEQEQIKKAKIR